MPYLSALVLDAVRKSCAVLSGLFLPDHDDLRVVGRARQRHDLLVFHRRLALDHGQQMRLRDQHDRVAVARLAVRVGERGGTAATHPVHHHELRAELARRMHHHHARGDVRAAAHAGMRHHLDRLRGEFLLRAQRRRGEAGGGDDASAECAARQCDLRVCLGHLSLPFYRLLGPVRAGRARAVSIRRPPPAGAAFGAPHPQSPPAACSCHPSPAF